MTVYAMPVMLGVLATLAVAYRYYSAFLAARVAVLNDLNPTPAHTQYDSQNYCPMNKWVLFGHHFAAISGAGPLIGPVLAIQFGYMPGLIWLVVGVCLAGAVQDMMVLAASVRRGGRSLAGIVRDEMGPIASIATAIAILYVVIIALAGLGIVVVKALGGEQVPMQAGTTLVFPEGEGIEKTTHPDGSRIYQIPPHSTYRYDPESSKAMVFEESFVLAIPAESEMAVSSEEDQVALTLPEQTHRIVPGSSWGMFTIACTIPIALLVGLYMYRIRPGKVVEASLFGAAAVLAATAAGAWIPGSALEPYFALPREKTVMVLAGYGFVASVLPVWLLMCPRDYLSSFLKIGTILLLVVGVIVANPVLQAPAVNTVFAEGGGPYFDGPIFPYVFICIMCGAISGFHSLVSSGTTPKMVDKETDVRMIGYGAMLMEGLVGVVALIAAAALPNTMYYDINIDLARRPHYEEAIRLIETVGNGHHDPHVHDHDAAGPGDDSGEVSSELAQMERDVHETLRGRTGGAVTLAVGMARIFTDATPIFRQWNLLGFWYHFAIMFEALFILTTIDTGTRIGRFMLQEFLGKVWKPLGDLHWLPASIVASGLIVCAWGYFIMTGTVDTIWPMFGLANQLLALIALTVVTTMLINAGRARYAWVTLLPMMFVFTTTSTAAWYEITGKYLPWMQDDATWLRGLLNTGLTLMLWACVLVILVGAVQRWVAVLRGSRPVNNDHSHGGTESHHA